MAFKFWQLDFVARPIESIAKAVFFWAVVLPAFCGFVWMEYNRSNAAGVVGAVVRRAANGAVEESRPEIKRLVGNREAFDLGGRSNASPRR